MCLTDTSSSQKKGIPFSSKNSFLLLDKPKDMSNYHCASQEVLWLNMCRRQVLVEMVLVDGLVSFISYGIVHMF